MNFRLKYRNIILMIGFSILILSLGIYFGVGITGYNLPNNISSILVIFSFIGGFLVGYVGNSLKKDNKMEKKGD